MTNSLRKNTKSFAVRKVLLADDGFVCGICRSSYESAPEAQRCLKVCTVEMMSNMIVERARHHGKLMYKCGCCRRLYEARETAENCLKDCRSGFVGKNSIDEVEGVEKRLRIAKTKPYQSQPKPQKIKLIPPYRLRKMVSEADIDAEIAAAEARGEGGGAGGADGTPAAKMEPVLRRKADLKDKFIRQGAQYQCAYCMQLYYTKVEVQSCFEAHPDEEIVQP
jgi:hypothetical protein